MLVLKDVENLCFEGGGMRAIAFVGVLKYLTEKGLISSDDKPQQIKRVIGSSAGSLYAVLVACRAPVSDIEEIVSTKNFSELKDDTWGYLFDVLRVINYYGICKGDALYDWYGEILEKFTGNKDITFKELYDKTKVLLVITGTNLNCMKECYFSHETHSDMPIRLAARISSSIPGFFKAVEFEGDLYVDGGTLNNFPIWYFEQYNVVVGGTFDRVLQEHLKIKTIGFRLQSATEHVNRAKKIVYDRVEIKNIKDYVKSLANCMCLQIDRGYIHGDYWKRTIMIPTSNIQSTNFSLSKESIEWLQQQGYNACVGKFI